MKLPPFVFCLLVPFLVACSSTGSEETGPLPFLGDHQQSAAGEVIHYRIPEFGFVDQDSQMITHETVGDQIYVTDFFFTSCLSICPKMKQQMIRVFEAYEGDPELTLLSHTIDPTYDSVAVLKEYAEALGIEGDQWHFLTGEADSIYAMAVRYFVSANEDPNSPDGFYHSDVFTLMDKNRNVRGYYHGTDSVEVSQLIRDIGRLKKEYESQNP